ncbi:MAG: hypothetical protein NC181_02660 [Clostridium sp.]|nr:hypothetical protein [Clostridium sp.]MCM1444137.1 hypothetical protein [Candidatus Amulumruptor caecigallinarius]
MKVLYLGILCFIFVYLFYLITVVTNKKKIKTFLDTRQAQYFIIKYKLNKDKIKSRGFANIISIANSLIISITLMVTEIVDNYLLKLLVGIVILIPLILFIYFIIGKIYKKKEGK